MRVVWEITVVDGVEYRSLVFCNDNATPPTVEKPNRTTFCPDAVLRSLGNARTFNGIDEAKRVMRKHGITTVKDQERLLKKFAPFYRMGVR